VNSTDFRILAHIAGVPIRKLSADTVTELKAAPQAQRRTAKYKKFVYVVNGLVFKGPYTCEEPSFLNNLRYAYAIKTLEEALQLEELHRGSLQWKYIGYDDDNRYYLVASNVGKRQDVPFELVTTKIETNVKVVPRGGHVSRVAELERNGRLTDDIKAAALQHLYLRFLLDIGDSGTHNILIREDAGSSGRLIAGVDLEERRAVKMKERRLDHLFKKGPSKEQIPLYIADIRKIKTLSDSQLDNRILDRLSRVGIDLNRLRVNTELWQNLK
jgi:hypothetical protein